MPSFIESPAGAPLAAQPERLAALEARALEELSAAWSELRDILDRQRAACRAVMAEESSLADVSALRALRASAVERCMRDPLLELERSGPERRANACVALHARNYENWLRLLPDAVELNGPDALELAAVWGRPAGRYGVLRWIRTPRVVLLRALGLKEAARVALARTRADVEILSAYADGSRQLGRCWTLAALFLDAQVDASIGRRQIERMAARVDAGRMRVQERFQRALVRRRALDENVLPSLASAVMGAIVRRPAQTAASPGADSEPWRPRVSEALDEQRLRLSLEHCEDGVLRSLDEATAAAAADGVALAAAAERMAELLERDGPGSEELRADIEVKPASARLADLDHAVAREVLVLSGPLTIAATFSHRMSGRDVEPAELVQDRYRAVMRPQLVALFERIQAEQHEAAGDMARAGDVVTFATRAVHAGDAPTPVVGEAIANAVALLRYRQDTPLQPPRARAAAAAVCQGFHDVRVALFGGPFERWTYGAGRELERGLPVATAALARGAGARIRRGGARAERLVHRFLARIGWRPDPSSGVVDVRIRPLLPEAFAADSRDAGLPALYSHLFRPDPVRDVRFLVGRVPELSAIGDARDRWEAGRSAALLVTGERGSGKTSLINCALNGPLAGLPVARGEFSQRLLSESDLRSTLAGIVGASSPGRLEEHLIQTPRVVVLEEVERTFLRHLGHYEAVRALGRLISATGGAVLWVIVLNRVAFRFLDAATGLGQRFSHRINASTATADEIREAILIRHNLSGLRLRFEPPATAPGRSIRRRVDPERAFFEMTARYAAGVYRTAFGIWLGHIAEIRDGLFSVRAIEAHDLLPVIADLAPPDLFSLVAFMQHGSLTAEEHAIIFQQRSDISRAQLDELIARDIIAADPGRPGYRVRPEAMSVVQEALYRRNLL
jgi:hypothetical protein